MIFKKTNYTYHYDSKTDKFKYSLDISTLLNLRDIKSKNPSS